MANAPALLKPGCRREPPAIAGALRHSGPERLMHAGARQRAASHEDARSVRLRRLFSAEVAMLPVTFLPRPSVLASVVVATSVATGLAAGVAAGGVLLLLASVRRS